LEEEWEISFKRSPSMGFIVIMSESLTFTQGGAMALVRVRGKYQVTIPKEVRRKLGLRVGDYLEVEVQGSAILLKPKALLDKDEALEKLRAVLEKLRERRAALSEEEVEREVLEAIRAVRTEGTGG
jgi:AbrB family looped-hinge helix DNA binding protein